MAKITRIVYYLEDYIQRIDSYKESIKDKPKLCVSDSQCNADFHKSDNKLADILNGLRKLSDSSTIMRFGIQIGEYNEKSKLRSLCCNCPGNPMPYYDKNKLRKQAEKIAFFWQEEAKKWLDSDRDLEILEKEKTTVSRPIKKKPSSGFKRKSFNY